MQLVIALETAMDRLAQQLTSFALARRNSPQRLTLVRVNRRVRRDSFPPLVVSWMTLDDLIESQVSMDETEELINVLRTVRESDAAAVHSRRRRIPGAQPPRLDLVEAPA